ncbi:Ankyrin repeat-containing domain, partial [Cinara cedri]
MFGWLKKDSNDTGVGQDFVHVISPLDDIKSALNEAIAGKYSKLDEVVKNIANYKDQFVVLETESFMNFYKQQLHLVLTGSYLYNIFFPYNLNQEKLVHKYRISELVLLAIAANDQLAEKYHEVLFAEENLSLLPLLIGGKQYISEFIKRFSELYQEQKLKEKTITVSSGKTIGFFSVIAANKYQELLKAVLTPDALGDLKLELQKAQEDPLYGVLELAALMENQVFIEKVLESIEQDISNKSSKDNESGEDELLLKRSFITLLATAVSQEHNSIVTYLCEKCTKNEDSVIQEAYKETLSDDKIIKQINKQILRNINGAGKGRRSKEQKMYDTILQTALCVNNMEFVAKILDSIESKPQISTIDEDGRDFLRNSLNTILEHAEGRTLIKKRMSAKPDGNVKKIYTEVYNNRKALDPTQKTDTTVSMEQDATELNFQGKHTMTKERKNPTAQEELPLSDDKDDSGIDSGSATASIQSLSRASGSTGSDTSLRGGVLTDDESQDEESKDQKPVKQVHFPSD